MKSLLVDTSQGLKAAYQDTDKNIVETINLDNLKLSEVFHTELDKLILKHNNSWNELGSYIYNLGPGSYTGLKIGSSLANSLQMTATKTFGFHEYNVPYILGYNKGVWIDQAFKKQIFVYEWDADNNSHYLIDTNDFYFKDTVDYFCKNDSVWEKANLISTQKLLLENNSEIIKSIVNNKPLEEEIFYYRTIDMEYNKS